jgi:hypothetical protein
MEGKEDQLEYLMNTLKMQSLIHQEYQTYSAMLDRLSSQRRMEMTAHLHLLQSPTYLHQVPKDHKDPQGPQDLQDQQDLQVITEKPDHQDQQDLKDPQDPKDPQVMTDMMMTITETMETVEVITETEKPMDKMETETVMETEPMGMEAMEIVEMETGIMEMEMETGIMEMETEMEITMSPPTHLDHYYPLWESNQK